MNIPESSLEPTSDEMHALLDHVQRHVVRHVTSLSTQATFGGASPERMAQTLHEPMPERGGPCEPLLDFVFTELARRGLNNGSPGALSYVNGGGLFHAAVADLIIAAINPYVAYWSSSPGFAELEQTVLRWFCDLLGMPTTSGGVLVSGGSTANLSAVVAARHAKLGRDFARGTLYTSHQVHHSVLKALLIAGFPSDAVRLLPTDDSQRVCIDALRATIARDRRAGRRPFCVVATAGTTNSGAVDLLEHVAEVARAEDLWLHVDAAYGGFFAMTSRGRAALHGIEHADSITMDPHKSLFLPFGTGCLIARDVATLRDAHRLGADYMRAAADDSARAGAVDFGDLSVEMSRNARGLRVWLPLKLLGAQTFRAALDEKLDLARWACETLAASEGFEIVAPPQLSTFAFRARCPRGDAAREDALNRRILARVNASGRAHLSATTMAGRFTLRMCVLSFRTHHDAVAACIDELRTARRAEPSTSSPAPFVGAGAPLVGRDRPAAPEHGTIGAWKPPIPLSSSPTS